MYIGHTIKCNALQDSVTMGNDDSEREYGRVGLLTETQRRYLDGVSDIESGSQRERTLRSRLRERIVGGLHDLFFLSMRNLEDRDVEQISEEVEMPQAQISHILSFLLRIYYDRLHYTIHERPDTVAEDIEGIIDSTITELYNKNRIDIESISVEVNIETGNEINMPDKKDLDSLNPQELAILWRAGEISWKEYVLASDNIHDASIEEE